MKKRMKELIAFLERHLDTKFNFYTNDASGSCNRVFRYDMLGETKVMIYLDFGHGDIRRYLVDEESLEKKKKKTDMWGNKIICDFRIDDNPLEDVLEIHEFREETLQKLEDFGFVKYNK